ncbi:hypothetical protein MHY85_10455 [Cellulomonas sp. ACRRI]|uniref:hypothetical protein n=1 Tax=Cellulomonas sp. ACRRI TaxID=2918188 RepID=UPI001EF1865A|nr:hypothetical protein [Cellulomonas sp. ACRRI]MCG7286389.1 hypothetical protein [Cellulomonas sp. ACRRI]
MQVKAREVAPAAADRETRWILKNIQAAMKQVDGTARRLSGAPVTMLNGRGRSMDVDGAKVTWVGVIVIDHPDPPEGIDIPATSGTTPSVALLRRDWEFLFDQLRSTRAVIEYLLRVAKLPAVPLGDEAFRYYDLAAADEDAPPGPIPAFLAGVGQRVTVPVLPSVPGYEEDAAGFELFRLILEDVATSPVDPEHELARQRALGSLDGIPVVQRASLGRLLLDFLDESRGVDDARTIWKFRTHAAGTDSDQIGFGVCSQLSDFTNEAFRRWLILRHHERCVRLGTTELTSMGVLLTPRPGRATEWDTTLAVATGDFQLSEEEIKHLYQIWPPQSEEAAR